jgi:hypothetical protein
VNINRIIISNCLPNPTFYVNKIQKVSSINETTIKRFMDAVGDQIVPSSNFYVMQVRQEQISQDQEKF